MKTKKEEFPTRSAHKRYAAQFKEQTLELADRDGIPKAAQDLGLAEATLQTPAQCNAVALYVVQCAVLRFELII